MPSQQDPAAAVEKLARPATTVRPRKLRRAESIPVTATKFGGQPYAQAGDTWPICGGCDRGLTFIAQFNLAECPHKPGLAGLVQFFYCHECQSWGDIPEDLEGAWAVRGYRSPDPAKAVQLDDLSPPEGRTRPCGATLAVRASFPDYENLPEDLAVRLAADGEEPWDAYAAAVAKLGGPDGVPYSHVGGHPVWIQGDATPDCPRCRGRMSFVIQIDSEEDAGFMWGDAGSVYLFQCPKHPDTVEMRAQCY